jgi:hypothetical protein
MRSAYRRISVHLRGTGGFSATGYPTSAAVGQRFDVSGPSGHRGTRLRAVERDRLDESALMSGILVFWRASQEQSELN